MNLLIQSLINSHICIFNQSPTHILRNFTMSPIKNNSATYTSLTNKSTINNKSNNGIFASPIYKSLITLLTKSLTKLLLLYLLLTNNQIKATSFQSISLTYLNLTTIKPTFMSNPNSPIRHKNTPPPSPSVGNQGTYTYSRN